jgi:hypothetical protein
MKDKWGVKFTRRSTAQLSLEEDCLCQVHSPTRGIVGKGLLCATETVVENLIAQKQFAIFPSTVVARDRGVILSYRGPDYVPGRHSSSYSGPPRTTNLSSFRGTVLDGYDFPLVFGWVINLKNERDRLWTAWVFLRLF